MSLNDFRSHSVFAVTHKVDDESSLTFLYFRLTGTIKLICVARRGCLLLESGKEG